MSKRRMHLVAHMCISPTSHHNGCWRHPESDVDEVLSPARYERLARIFERGLFDGAFFVDYSVLQDLTETSPSVLAKYGGQMMMLDPIQILTVMAGVTKHIGLSATLSTSFHHAYSIARTFATLDHISSGRAGWNIVTSTLDAEAQNFGFEHLPDKSLRYDQADQVVEACMALWHSWEADAVKIDRKSGIFADPDKIHYIKYNGSMVKTRGALTSPQSPQGHPVLMQAGASERGRQFAARWAEVIFTHQQEKAPMQAFYADMKSRVQANGRRPEDCVILPSIDVVVGDTEALAQEEADYRDSFVNMEMSLKTMSAVSGVDVSQIPLDTFLVDIVLGPRGPATEGTYQNLMAIRKDGRGLTLGEAAKLQGTTWWSPRFIGTPSIVADQMEDAFRSGCCDGFILALSLSPGGYTQFVEKVVPELQRRGIYRTEYAGRTFRENLQS